MSQTPPNQPSRTDDTPPRRYTATLAGEIELRWQRAWEERGAFVVPNPGQPGFDASRPKYYVLDMFPYPSGAGLHVGHPEGYTATDILSRYKRMKGFNVLHPMGYDAFGLPAEQYAIETGVHPAITTKTAIENFRRQLRRFGFCYDWSREFATIDPGYYKWTQWIFLKLYDAWYDESAAKCRPIAALIDQQAKLGATREGGAWGSLTEVQRRAFVDSRRLAYLAETTVNWCPKLGTVLANDEVIDGKSERGGHPVLRKPMKQWMFRITALAERLLKNLEKLDWPSSTKTMQAEWIGRSEGAEISFELSDLKSEISHLKVQISDHPSHASRLTSLTVFTTRPDTVFGATYMVVAPEHDLCVRVLAGECGVDEPTRTALRKYVDWARNRSDVERQESKTKTGVFTGVHANNPATGENIPVWTADYVLMGYGHGAIMAVPAHDERDFEFANEFGLPIRDVVYPRTVLAMRYFALHSREQERRPEVWADQLADFLGLVTSSNAPETEFEQALARVRAGRRASALQSGVSAQTGSSDAERRGAIKGAWTETIDDMGLESPAQLREQFERGRYYAASGAAYPGSGVNVNSGPLDGLHTPESKKAIGAGLSERGVGGEKVTYRLRDWTFSRQRYWGEPFPIVYDADGRVYPVSEAGLPVTLPDLADYAPVESDDPMPLLGKVTAWRNTTAGEAGVDPVLLPANTPVTRECNTMPGSAGSSWYFLRYCDSKNDLRPVGTEAERYWMGGSGIGLPADGSGAKIGGVDFYLGGAEHAVGHLLYARFWQNVLFDLGYVGTPEPFQRLFHQGMITSFAYQRADKSLVPVDQVDEPHEGKFIERATGKPVAQIVAKMSKSLKNVVNPDDVIAEYGADTFRLYEMYMGPLEASKPWNPRDIAGCFRFLQRAWRVMVDERTGELRAAPSTDAAIEKLLHRTIAKVGEDIERLTFNTAIAAMIELVNAATGAAGTNPALTRDQVARFSLILAPFAPHMAEEVWAKLGNTGFIAHAPWPTHDPAMLEDDTVELAVQIQGKVRGHIRIATDAPTSAIEAAALAEPRVVEALAGRPVKKVIVVPRKLVNVVV